PDVIVDRKYIFLRPHTFVEMYIFLMLSQKPHFIAGFRVYPRHITPLLQPFVEAGRIVIYKNKEGYIAHQVTAGKRHEQPYIEPDAHFVELIHAITIDKHRRGNGKEHKNYFEVLDFPPADIVVFIFGRLYGCHSE